MRHRNQANRKHHQGRQSGNHTNTDMSQEAVDNIKIIEVDMNRTNTCMKDMDNTAFRQVDITALTSGAYRHEQQWLQSG